MNATLRRVDLRMILSSSWDMSGLLPQAPKPRLPIRTKIRNEAAIIADVPNTSPRSKLNVEVRKRTCPSAASKTEVIVNSHRYLEFPSSEPL
jgi:hypothetical protein